MIVRFTSTASYKKLNTHKKINGHTKHIEIQIDGNNYTISESFGRLNINKSNGDNICIYPYQPNTIELS